MNVSITYKMYYHTISTNFSNVEWVTITNNKVRIRVGNATTYYECSKIVNMSVTQ